MFPAQEEGLWLWGAIYSVTLSLWTSLRKGPWHRGGVEDAGVFQDPGHKEKEPEIANEYWSLEASNHLLNSKQGFPADVHVFGGPTTLPVPWTPNLRGGITGSTCGRTSGPFCKKESQRDLFEFSPIGSLSHVPG